MSFLQKLAKQAEQAAKEAQAKLQQVGKALVQQANAVNNEAAAKTGGGHVLVFGPKKSRRVRKVKKSRSKKSPSRKTSRRKSRKSRKTSRRKSKSRKH